MHSIAGPKFRPSHHHLTTPPPCPTTKNSIKCSVSSWWSKKSPRAKAIWITLYSVAVTGNVYKQYKRGTFASIGIGKKGGGGGGASGGGGGGGSGGGGNFWSRFILIEEEDENEPKEWDFHGFKSDIVVVELKNLSMFKSYMVSDVSISDLDYDHSLPPVGEFYHKRFTIKAGNVYTKFEIEENIQTLTESGVFSTVKATVKPNVDGTIGLIFSVIESYDYPTGFSCVNIGELKDVTKNKNTKGKKPSCRDRILRSKPCLLPAEVNVEILDLLAQGKGWGARMVNKIEKKIKKWYHDEGYKCANVGDFWRLNDTHEYVCEIVEGDITNVLILSKDMFGNVVDGTSNVGLVTGKLPKQLQIGSVFNTKAAEQAIRNINSLGLYSNVEIKTAADEKYEGGQIVEVSLTELDQKSPHGVTCEGSVISFRGLTPTLEGLAFTIDNVHPIFDRVACLQNLTVHTNFFKKQMFGPVLSPTVYGFRIYANQVLPNQLKLMYGYLLEKATSGEAISKGVHKFFAKGAITKGNGFLNGAISGNKDLFQIGIEMGAKVKEVPGYLFVRNDPNLRWNDLALSYGVGAKLGLVRAEFIADQHSRTGALQFRLGD